MRSDDTERETGRTTGLMLEAIGGALLNRGHARQFLDHEPMTATSAKGMHGRLAKLCGQLEIHMKITTTGNRIIVESLAKSRAEKRAEKERAAEMAAIEDSEAWADILAKRMRERIAITQPNPLADVIEGLENTLAALKEVEI